MTLEHQFSIINIGVPGVVHWNPLICMDLLYSGYRYRIFPSYVGDTYGFQEGQGQGYVQEERRRTIGSLYVMIMKGDIYHFIALHFSICGICQLSSLYFTCTRMFYLTAI